MKPRRPQGLITRRTNIDTTNMNNQIAHINGDGTKMQIYLRSMGKLLAVTAIFFNDSDCNAYLENHRDEGVIAEGGGLVFCANLYDHGTRAELPKSEDKTKVYSVPQLQSTRS